MKRVEIKKEIKDSLGDVKSYEELIHKFSIYLFDNYIRRKVKIDSEKIIKLKKDKKKNASSTRKKV